VRPPEPAVPTCMDTSSQRTAAAGVTNAVAGAATIARRRMLAPRPSQWPRQRRPRRLLAHGSGSAGHVRELSFSDVRGVSRGDACRPPTRTPGRPRADPAPRHANAQSHQAGTERSGLVLRSKGSVVGSFVKRFRPALASRWPTALSPWLHLRECLHAADVVAEFVESARIAQPDPHRTLHVLGSGRRS
jgi:hypothetical protein